MKEIILLASLLLAWSALASDPGVTDKELLLGQHAIQSGAFTSGSTFAKGMSAYFDWINEKEGGVAGRKIVLKTIDTAGDSGKALLATQRLIDQDHVFAVIGGQGSMHEVVYKFLIQKKVPDLFVNDSDKQYTVPPNDYVFPMGFSFVMEGEAYGKYITKHLSGKKVCFLLGQHAAGPQLHDAVKGVIDEYNKTASEKQKIPLGISETVSKMATQTDSEVMHLKNANCDVVVASYNARGATMIEYAYRQNFKPAWFVLYPNAMGKMISLLEPAAVNGVISSSHVAISDKFGSPGWDQFVKVMKNPDDVVGNAAEGYSLAESFVEILKRLSKDKKEVTRQNVLAEMENLRGWKCSLCLAPYRTSKTNHWSFEPTLIVAKDGKWTQLKE